MKLLKKITVYILILCFAVPAAASINVVDCGAKGDGETDDTAAICAAVQRAIGSTAVVRAANLQNTTIPEVIFPSGRYRITDTVQLPGGFTIRGEGNPIIEMSDPGKDIIKSDDAWRMTIDGLTFIGGSKSLAFSNPNIDSGMITISNCRFSETSKQAIETSLRSTVVYVEKCIFSGCEQTLTTTTDMVTIRDSWINTRPTMSDKAVIEARGDIMVLENVCLVPIFSGGTRQRWIDNYSGFYLQCRNVRFGGEGGGVTPVYNYSPVRRDGLGSSVLLEGCLVAANASYDANCAVYCVEVPNNLAVTSNILLGGRPVIVDKKVNLQTYFTGLSPEMLSFSARDNVGVSGNEMPELLTRPVCLPDKSRVGVSDKEAKSLLAAARSKVKSIAGSDATGLSTTEHKQKIGAGGYINLSPDKYKWDLSDKMDATIVPNSTHLAYERVGTDVVIMRRTLSTDNWPHMLIGPVDLDLDRYPWITWKQKDPGTDNPKSFAVRVIDLESGKMALLAELLWPDYYGYYAFDLRKAMGISGKRKLMVKFYFTGNRPVGKEEVHSQPGDFLLLDFIRAEAD